MIKALGAHALHYRWLLEARAAATRMAKLRVDRNQSFGATLRTSQIIPKHGLIGYQRFPSHAAMLSVSSFDFVQANKPFVKYGSNRCSSWVCFNFLSGVALDLYFFHFATCVLRNFCHKKNWYKKYAIRLTQRV